MSEEYEQCEACYGQGVWETECCDGSYGCSCRGQRVEMGECNVCQGRGYYRKAEPVNRNANIEAQSGYSFIGTGPTPMMSCHKAMGKS